MGLQLHSFLTSVLHGVSDQLHARHTLPWGNNIRYPLNRRVGGTLCRTGRSGEENTLLFLPIDEPRSLGFLVFGVVAILTKSIG